MGKGCHFWGYVEIPLNKWEDCSLFSYHWFAGWVPGTGPIELDGLQGPILKKWTYLKQ